MGPAQIATLIDKIVRKRFDSLHGSWIEELGEVGAVAIPQILREMKQIGPTEKDRLSPAFLDLRNVLQSMGADAESLLKEAIGLEGGSDQPSPTDIPPWLAAMAEELDKSWKKPEA